MNLRIIGLNMKGNSLTIKNKVLEPYILSMKRSMKESLNKTWSMVMGLFTALMEI